MLARVGFGYISPHKDLSMLPRDRKGRILVVVGAGHLDGISQWLATGGVSDERIAEISSSRRHPSSWPGKGVLSLVDLAKIKELRPQK